MQMMHGCVWQVVDSTDEDMNCSLKLEDLVAQVMFAFGLL